MGKDVDQIKSGSIILHHETSNNTLSRSFDFGQDHNCILAINFSAPGFNATERNVIQNTLRIRIVIDQVHAEDKKKRGFKADLFIKKKVAR